MRLNVETSPVVCETVCSLVRYEEESGQYAVCHKDTPDEWWSRCKRAQDAIETAEGTDRFWEEKCEPEVRDAVDTVRVNGVHYIVGRPDEKFKGYGGRRWVIRRDDGAVVVTDNLWCQGKIPTQMVERLPDNAMFGELVREDEREG